MTAVAALLAGLPTPPGPRDEAAFGLTEYLLLRPPGTLAADYVPGGPVTVIAAVRRCGGRHTTYREYTEGGAGVFFTRKRSEASTRACLKKVLPQVNYRPAESP